MHATCSVCGNTSADTLLVSGPSVYLCSNCIFASIGLLLDGGLVNAEAARAPGGMDGTYCSFCGKSRRETRGMVGYNGTFFACTECLGKCVEIVADKAIERAPAAPVVLAIPAHGGRNDA